MSLFNTVCEVTVLATNVKRNNSNQEETVLISHEQEYLLGTSQILLEIIRIFGMLLDFKTIYKS